MRTIEQYIESVKNQNAQLHTPFTDKEIDECFLFLADCWIQGMSAYKASEQLHFAVSGAVELQKIDVTQLQIGNSVSRVFYNPHPEKSTYALDFKCTVEEVGRARVNIKLSDNSITRVTLLEYIKPIVLTYEILMQCGFTKQLKYGEQRHYDYTKDALSIFGLEAADFSINGRRIKFLHQLQNLYHSIHLKELVWL